PVFNRPLPFGFLIYVEARPGMSGRSVARTTFNWSPSDPSLLPDFQIWSSEDLGDPTEDVCDTQRPRLGGVPPLVDPMFGTQTTANTINDLSCRFDARGSSEFACTVGQFVPFAYTNPNSTVQFCTTTGIGQEVAFPLHTDTQLSVRVRDS